MIYKTSKILFPNKSKSSPNGFCILKAVCIDCEDEEKKNNEITIKGTNLPLKPNTLVDCDGYWKEDKNGEAFNVTAHIAYVQPEDIVEELAVICGGIGVRPARLIYEAYGDKTFEKLDKDPLLIKQVETISPRKRAEIYKNYISKRLKLLYVRELRKLGMPGTYINKVVARLNERSVTTAYLDPYKLCDIGIPFIYIDKMVKDNSLNLSDRAKENRISACLLDILYQAENGGKYFKQTSGHCCVPLQEWVDDSQKTLNIAPEMLGESIKRLVEHKRIKLVQNSGQIYVYRKDIYEAEINTAAAISTLSRAKLKPIKDIQSDIKQMEKKAGFSLAPEQANAVTVCLENTVSVITGGPGTGKSTILDFIRRIYTKNNPDKTILMLAPTGKAAQRMAETTGCKAATIHKGLNLKVEADGEFGKPEPINADFILIDEISMLDIFIAEKLFNSISKGTKVVLIGDVEQLPSVGPGAVLNDIIESGAIPVAKLTKVYRQAGDSSIAINANLIKNGKADFDYDDNYIFIPSESFDQSAEVIEKLYLEEVKNVGIDNVVYLSPYRVKGTATSVSDFNERIHDKINPPEGKPYIKVKGEIYRVGDKVMATANTNAAANGDVGYITEITGNDVYICFNGETAKFDRGSMENIVLAYATTVHKSQGSEYMVVIFNLQDEHGMMKKRNLLYTAITRAKKKVYIVGSNKAIQEAVLCGIQDKDKRYTMLSERLKG